MGMIMVMMRPNLSREFKDQTCEVLKHLAMIGSKILRHNYIKQLILDGGERWAQYLDLRCAQKS